MRKILWYFTVSFSYNPYYLPRSLVFQTGPEWKNTGTLCRSAGVLTPKHFNESTLRRLSWQIEGRIENVGRHASCGQRSASNWLYLTDATTKRRLLLAAASPQRSMIANMNYRRRHLILIVEEKKMCTSLSLLVVWLFFVGFYVLYKKINSSTARQQSLWRPFQRDAPSSQKKYIYIIFIPLLQAHSDKTLFFTVEMMHSLALQRLEKKM